MADELSSYGYSAQEIAAMRKAMENATRNRSNRDLADALEKNNLAITERNGIKVAWFCDGTCETMIQVDTQKIIMSKVFSPDGGQIKCTQLPKNK